MQSLVLFCFSAVLYTGRSVGDYYKANKKCSMMYDIKNDMQRPNPGEEEKGTGEEGAESQ